MLYRLCEDFHTQHGHLTEQNPQRYFERNIARIAPNLQGEDLHQCGRAIRRAICAALLDKRMSADELRGELRILIDRYVSRTLVQV